MGVQVVDRDTFEPIGFGRSWKRNLILFVPFLPLVVGLTLARGSRPGDGWANTRVVWKRHAKHGVFRGGLVCEHCRFDLTGNTSGICPECGTSVFRAGPSCRHCHFDLTGNTTGACPECGAPIPETDRRRL